MNEAEVITEFYSAFAKHDAEGMVALYHEDVEFSDPAFGTLRGERAKDMWRMLIGRANGNLEVQFKNVTGSSGKGSAHWTAKYTYGPKKRLVVNEIDAVFEIKDGKILRHNDHFDIWKWSKMALGLPGQLLGWTPFIKSKIRQQANKSLDKFIAKKAT